MKTMMTRFGAGLLLMSLLVSLTACNKGDQPANAAQAPNNTAANTAGASAPAQMAKFTDHELDELLAPVALYPDPLLAQMLPAATFVDEIIEAQRELNGKTEDDLIANKNWDVSVKSIAHYPPVLKKMAEDPDWTAALGQAYIEQPTDINQSIQRLRFQASDAGNLATTKQAAVIEKDNIIRIEPAEPEVIYVPEYNSETVYVEEQVPAEVYVDDGPSTGEVVAATAIAFGAGLLIGAWLNRDYDYYGYYGPPGPYYHGWNGAGWIGANQSYVNMNVNRNVYINDSYRNINVNRGVYNRNVAQYRSGVTQRAGVRNQRVTNARVNRHRERNNGGLDRDRVGDRNQLDRDGGIGDRGGAVGGRNIGDRGGAVGDRNIGDRRSTAGDRNIGGNQRDLGSRDGATRRDNTPARQAPSSRPATRQQPQRSAPQRSAPSRGGGGGGRRR